MTDIEIHAGHSATTRSIGELADRLRAIPANKRVSIDTSELAEVDLSFVQLMLSLRKHAAAQGQEVHLAKPATGYLAFALARAGFLTDPADADVDFWFHGELPQ